MTLTELILLISLVGLYLGGSDGKDCPPNPPAKQSLQRLRETLFCEYSPSARPVTKLNESVSVRIAFNLEEIRMIESEHVMRLEGILNHMWNDAFLRWKPTEYDGITFFRVEQEIWLPDISTNIMSQAGVEEIKPSNCIVSYTGMISCLPKVSFSSPCLQNLRLWPYDIHNCSVTFSSYLHYEHQLNLSSAPIYINNYRSGGEWEILSAQVIRRTYNFSDIPYPFIQYLFTLRRQATAYQSSTVTPAVALLFVTLMTFWMGSQLGPRVTVCGFVLMGSTTQLAYLIYLIPPNGTIVPVVMTLYRDGLSLAAFGIIIAITINCLANSDSQPPYWISAVTDKLEMSFAARILLLDSPVSSQKSDEVAILDSPAKHNPWASFNILLDRIAFLAALLVVLILLMGYIP